MHGTSWRKPHRLDGGLPVQPDEAFGGSVLLLLELVEHKLLEGPGECRGSELAIADFLMRVGT